MINKAEDSVQGLIDFVKLVKPFHTKIIEVLIEHEHSENVNTTISDSCVLEESLSHELNDHTLAVYGENDDQRTHGDPQEFILVSPDVNNSFVGSSNTTRAINIVKKQFIIAGDQRQFLNVGDIFKVDVFKDELAVAPLTINSYTANSIKVDGDASPITIGQKYWVFFGDFEGEQQLTVTGKSAPIGIPSLTEIFVSETVTDVVVGKYFGLKRDAISVNTLSNYFTISDVEFNVGTLNSWPGYPNIANYVLGNVPHTIITTIENIQPQPPFSSLTFTPVDGNSYSGILIPSAISVLQVIDNGTYTIALKVAGNKTKMFGTGFQFNIVGGDYEGLYTTMHSYVSGGDTYVYYAERRPVPTGNSLGVIQIKKYGLNDYSPMRKHVPQTNVECFMTETLEFYFNPPLTPSTSLWGTFGWGVDNWE